MFGGCQVSIKSFYVVVYLIQEVGVEICLIVVGIKVIDGNYKDFGVQVVFDYVGNDCYLFGEVVVRIGYLIVVIVVGLLNGF